ncbi:MAG: hypothetical protein IVW54_18835 [Candidatus Binataceae bacterium]|nr:hypothetical protein [Candidatus Binataceae bacterium]
MSDHSGIPLAMDFFADMAELARQELLASGYTVDSSRKPDEIVMSYFNVLWRRINVRPRTVFIAKDLKCPADLQAGFDLVRAKAQKGEDIRPHQSRKLADLDFDDGLLNDWGINHLHLGTSLESDGFVTRTGPVLFARVTADEFYCVAVMEHGNWSKQQLLDIIHDNWPASISRSTLRGVGLEWQPTDDDVRKLRAAGVTVITQRPDGTIHFPPGGGVATDRTSMSVVNRVIGWRTLCSRLEEETTRKLDDLLQEATRLGVELRPPLRFHLKISGGKTRAVEEASQAFVDFGPALAVEKIAGAFVQALSS